MINDKNKLVSVIIANYNNEIYIKQCIESIINQTYKNIEIIIVDDKSTDNSINVIKNLNHDKIHIIQTNENVGPGSARNIGILHSNGEYILPVDSDNFLELNAINIFVEEMNKNCGDIIYCSRRLFGDKNKIYNPPNYSLDSLKKDNYIDTCSMFKKTQFVDIGGFDESDILRGFEDWELFLNMGLHGYFGRRIDNVLINYRVHSDSLLHKSRKKIKDVIRYIYNKHNIKEN